jgi:tRNA U34 5-methylaminomethyl-2-thiouridine-forming methyltransferase MnmC
VAREIIVTSDGSHSLLNTELNETYHSVHGAVQESKHVFIENGLHHWWRLSNSIEVNILEVGFGTGLNALLAFQASREQQVKINYATIEAFPLPNEVWIRLNYPATLGDEQHFHKMHEVSWDAEHEISATFHLTKYYTTLQAVRFLPQTFDVIFFDAFAPAKQPDMWTLEMLQKATDALKPGGVFVTYCARGQLKRDLKELGFRVETLPGPPGKKEMVRGIKTDFSRIIGNS